MAYDSIMLFESIQSLVFGKVDDAHSYVTLPFCMSSATTLLLIVYAMEPLPYHAMM